MNDNNQTTRISYVKMKCFALRWWGSGIRGGSCFVSLREWRVRAPVYLIYLSGSSLKIKSLSDYYSLLFI